MTKVQIKDGYVPRSMDMRELYEVLNYKKYVSEMIDDLKANTEISLEYIKKNSCNSLS